MDRVDHPKTEPDLPRLRAVAFRSGEWWVGQFLEYDLATQTRRLEDMPAELERLVRVQMLASVEDGITPFEGLNGSPLPFWEKYQAERARKLESPSGIEIHVLEADDPISEESPAWANSSLGPFTYPDYVRVPKGPRCELIYGRLYRMGRVTVAHQTCLQVFLHRLETIEKAMGGLMLFGPLDCILAPHTVAQPDLLYIASERMGIVGDYIEGAPDLVIEVLGPPTIQRDRAEKLRAYREFGVREYWLVDPEAKAIEFLWWQDGGFVVELAVDGMYRSKSLPGFQVDLAELWLDFGRRLPGMEAAFGGKR